MNVFNVKYFTPGKPTGTRITTIGGPSTYEDALIFRLDRICETYFYSDFSDSYVASHFKITRIKATKPLCIYEVYYREMYGRIPKERVQIVEIECICNDLNIDLLKEEYEFEPFQELESPEKSKRFTNWVLKEKRGIRMFLYFLENAGSLKKLKTEALYSRAQFYRNLKYCVEKGYIVNNKLTRRIMIKK